LLKDDQVEPKHIAIDCDFGVVLDWDEEYAVASTPVLFVSPRLEAPYITPAPHTLIY
jgi:hypothetical protein